MARIRTPQRRRMVRSEDVSTVTTPQAGTAQAATEDRQAVVIVHGMGEQRPLETLRGFVEAVWGGTPTPGHEPSDSDVWLVPDNRAGLTELARITTRKVEGVRTDFYELYWSDLLVGNTLTQLRAWVRGLLWRWPHQVPRESASLWISLWIIVIIVLFLAALAGFNGSWGNIWSLVTEGEPVLDLWAAGASVVLWGILFYALSHKLRSDFKRRKYAEETLPGIWATISPAKASVSYQHSIAVAFLVPVIVALAAYFYFPWMLLVDATALPLILAAAIAFVLGAWVVPVFGDVARYVRTSPDAVSARAAIRDRGVELLRALHGPAEGDFTTQYDHGKLSSYNRIVVVGHSLGSIIAYDVLRLFWEERGPTRLNPASHDEMKALAAVDAYCRKHIHNPEALKTKDFRDLQEKASAKLAERQKNWRVTDLVTVGSPLTHAEFLISRDRALFEHRKAERLFPTCPPMMEPGKTPSFLYKPEGSDQSFAHHAAMFSTMRWTNIYNPSRLILLGDFISGPCRPNFGPGIIDCAVNIRKGGLLSRLVTHADYWNAEASGYASDKDGEKLDIPNLSKDHQAHLTLLKKALALRSP
ncbi:MAG: hypothetical protein WDZ83_06710 [Rhizobiaceae bacterium]